MQSALCTGITVVNPCIYQCFQCKFQVSAFSRTSWSRQTESEGVLWWLSCLRKLIGTLGPKLRSPRCWEKNPHLEKNNSLHRGFGSPAPRRRQFPWAERAIDTLDQYQKHTHRVARSTGPTVAHNHLDIPLGHFFAYFLQYSGPVSEIITILTASCGSKNKWCDVQICSECDIRVSLHTYIFAKNTSRAFAAPLVIHWILTGTDRYRPVQAGTDRYRPVLSGIYQITLVFDHLDYSQCVK